jgi:hypothetical protein
MPLRSKKNVQTPEGSGKAGGLLLFEPLKAAIAYLKRKFPLGTRNCLIQ